MGRNDLLIRTFLSIIWEVMGIGIPASVESVLFTSGRLLTQMFVAGMGTSVIAGNLVMTPTY
ncbi:hypothetical protein [Escherichia coli]